MSTLLAIWNEIPDGSRLELSLGPDTGDPPLEERKVTAAALVTDTASGQLIEKWEFLDLVPGPAEMPIRTGQRTSVRLSVRFLEAVTVIIHARVVMENGTTFEEPVSKSVPGSPGPTRGFQILLVAER